MRSFFCGSLLCLGALLGSGCEWTEFTAVSTPPPGKIAELDDGDRRVEIGERVALAIECSNSTGPCRDVVASSDDPDCLRVYPAYVDYLVAAYENGRYEGMRQASVFVLTGQHAGKTRLRFQTNAGSATFDVTVHEDVN
ncbi:MAG: hypothetical protein JXR96_10665 [Deltaproteobacteria bacterium]|nr:hypothetical protein [Deltaproteobacteria bacterium]